MTTVIRLKRSETAGVIPTTNDIAVGELAINLADGLLFSKKTDGSIIEVGGGEEVPVFFAEEVDLGGLTGEGEASLIGIPLATTLSVAQGGTGAVTLTGVVKGSGTGALTAGTVSLTTEVSGTLPVGSGGTGLTSYAVGDILFASTTTALSKLAGVATGNALISGGVGVAPAYGKIGLTTHVSGTLPVANGGTGATTSTGTTSVVLSNTPTLVTPILGAASATSIANSLGAVGTPSYTFTGDLNTGMFSPIADTVAVSTNGAERLRVASTGNVGIGTTNPLFPLHVNGEVRGTKFTSDAGSQSLANTTDLAVLTLTGNPGPQVYLVSMGVNAGGGSANTVALVTVGTNGSGGRNAALTKLVTAQAFTTDITVTNAAGTSTVNVKQSTGITQTISFSITRLM